MKFQNRFIGIDGSKRTGEKNDLKLIIIHWWGPQGHKATNSGLRNWLATKNGLTSWNIQIDKDGNCLCVIPYNEVAHGVGDSAKGVDKKLYTKRIRDDYKLYTTNRPIGKNAWMTPDQISVHLEIQPINEEGEFSQEALYTAKVLSTYFCMVKNLDPYEAIVSHSDVIGHDVKMCPRRWENGTYWHDGNLQKLEFIRDVDNMKRINHKVHVEAFYYWMNKFTQGHDVQYKDGTWSLI